MNGILHGIVAAIVVVIMAFVICVPPAAKQVFWNELQGVDGSGEAP